MQRFDEIELQAVPLIDAALPAPPLFESAPSQAPRFRRLLALLTDLSLFAALALALSPLLPTATNAFAIAATDGMIGGSPTAFAP